MCIPAYDMALQANLDTQAISLLLNIRHKRTSNSFILYYIDLSLEHFTELWLESQLDDIVDQL